MLPRHYIEKHQLVIPKIKRDDEGDYVCMATNAKGTAEDHFKLRTTGSFLEWPTLSATYLYIIRLLMFISCFSFLAYRVSLCDY